MFPLYFRWGFAGFSAGPDFKMTSEPGKAERCVSRIGTHVCMCVCAGQRGCSSGVHFGERSQYDLLVGNIVSRGSW